MVVRALVLREIRTRFGTDHFGYIWALTGPATMVLMFAAMHALVGRAGANEDLIGFLTTGLLGFMFFREVTSRCASAIDANRALLFYPQVRPFDLIIARSQLEVATLAVVFVLLMGGNALWTQQLHVDNPLGVLLGLGLSAALGVGLGLNLCWLSLYSPSIDRIVNILLRPMFWISGVFYSVNNLPSQARDLLLLNPVLHCVELTRDGWFVDYTSHYADPYYPLAWIIGFFSLGLVLERVARRRIEVV